MKRIQVDYKLPLEGTIIDFETTHWEVDTGELITAGFLSKEGIVIFQRLKITEDDFKEAIIKEIQDKRRPWYAFRKEFEEEFLSISIDRDLQQYKRESAFRALLEEGLFDHYQFLNDPLFNEEMKRFWDAWKSTKDMVFVSKIVRHNYCCLAKEYYLKLKRVDKFDPSKIKLLPSSAKIEKTFIRRQLGLIVE